MKRFGDITGVHIIADDMIVAADTVEEHDKILHQVMQRARQENVQFNKRKLQFQVSQVLYMGNLISAEGLKPDRSKIEAILDMPTPEDKPALQRLLGMVKFLSPYIPNESEITAPLRMLLKKEAAWNWQPEHDKSLQRVKKVLVSKPVLRFYDVSQPVTIQADACQTGLGCCLMQEGQLIHYASRAMTEAEKNYAQIEKELLTICFACNKFHQYVFGKTVNVQTDHRPLEAIFRKPLGNASPRLQRMLLKLQRYDLEVKYVPGKLMHMADTLSRAYLSNTPTDDSFSEDLEVMVHALARDIPVGAGWKAQIRAEAAEDPELQILRRATLLGWPRCKHSAPAILQEYWAVKNDMHLADGMLCVDDRILVPRSLQQEVLALLHESHMGSEKMKARARRALYWTNMSTDIDRTAASCTTCLHYRNAQQREPLNTHTQSQTDHGKNWALTFSHLEGRTTYWWLIITANTLK